MARMQVQKARARSAAQVLVGCRRRRNRRRAPRRRPETRPARDRRRAAGARPRACAAATMSGRSASRCPVLNITCDTTTRSARAPIARTMSAVSKRPSGARLDQRQRDAAAPRVLAQDDVERIELAARGHHARHAVVRVEDRAQALAGAGLGHDAVGARRAEQTRQPLRDTPASPRPTRPTRRPCCAYHAAIPSRTSSSVASSGRPSEWLAR